MNLPSFSAMPWKWYGLALLVIVVDQITKQSIVGSLGLYEQDKITSFFYLTLRHNPGAAFSMFADFGGAQRYFLGALAAIVSVVLAVWIARLPKSNRMEACALALILGGALGNLYDRVLLGHVVDFLVVHYQGHEWPAFNVADAGISMGAVLLIYDALFSRNKEKRAKTEVKAHD
ncbi:signal peptidase II . Aspartic peptidase. MEROPS family A08 [Alteromonadaceae bacterium Bs31]|nr:signal peptidase II . Aspartic peptidase. MEROPS family A08 [Alteromonadaceae bacterium Bs31]